jgi:ABC-type ATPase involved in cell division
VVLRLIAGIYDPDEGDVRIGNRSMAAVGPENRNVGMAFQNFALYPHRPAFDNIASPLRARRVGEDEVRRRAFPLLSRPPLPPRTTSNPRNCRLSPSDGTNPMCDDVAPFATAPAGCKVDKIVDQQSANYLLSRFTAW